MIVLDPGHGGRDTGAVGPTGTFEKVINLDLAYKVRQYLQRLGHEILLTREADTFVSLQERWELANQSNADIFVSIHCNASDPQEAEGLEVWHDNAMGPNVALAYAVLRWLLVTTARVNRGTKYKESESEEFAVLRNTTMPGCLVETAFLTNPTEEGLLSEAWYREKVALGITFGVESFARVP